jgi:7-carboxy-7-deazaguanine synthase
VEHLQAARDEVKFVLTNRADYDWAKQQIREHALAHRVRAILLSPAHGSVACAELAQWILDDRLQPPVRLHLQLHKHIYGPNTRGV